MVFLVAVDISLSYRMMTQVLKDKIPLVKEETPVSTHMHHRNNASHVLSPPLWIVVSPLLEACINKIRKACSADIINMYYNLLNFRNAIENLCLKY